MKACKQRTKLEKDIEGLERTIKETVQNSSELSSKVETHKARLRDLDIELRGLHDKKRQMEASSATQRKVFDSEIGQITREVHELSRKRDELRRHIGRLRYTFKRFALAS